MRRTSVYAVVVFVAALISALAFNAYSTPRVNADMPPAASLKTLLEAQITAKTAITLQFATPFIGGETVLTLPDDGGRKLAEVGDDYLCVSLPWNDGVKLYCTPFANVVGVNFLK